MRITHERGEQGHLRDRLDPVEPPPGTEGLTADDAAKLLRRNQVGRVAFARHDEPIMLPVNYAVDRDGAVVFRTTRGTKLWVAENESVTAAFEVDEFDPETQRGATVVVHGAMRPVVDLIDIRRLEDLELVTFADAVDRQRWVRISPVSVEGWVFSS